MVAVSAVVNVVLFFAVVFGMVVVATAVNVVFLIA